MMNRFPNFAFNFNLRRYTLGPRRGSTGRGAGGTLTPGGGSKGGGSMGENTGYWRGVDGWHGTDGGTRQPRLAGVGGGGGGGGGGAREAGAYTRAPLSAT
jgi:hypothetical protein